MAYNDAILNEADRQKVKALGEQWHQYNAAGNTAAAQNAHQQAENIRAKYGYSGGADGSQYIQTGENTQLYSAQNQSAAVNSAYDASADARAKALETAYNQKVLGYDATEAKIAPTYDAQRANTATQYEIGRANMNERALASGLNTGTGMQAALSQNNQYQANLTALNQAEAEARADLELERAKASAYYRDQVAQAIAENDAERAQALYNEAIRVDNSLVSTSANQAALDAQRAATAWSKQAEQAETLAKYGDFSGYKALGYTDDQIAQMKAVWNAENADLLALMNGTVYSGGGTGGGSSGRRSSGGASSSGGTGYATGNRAATTTASRSGVGAGAGALAATLNAATHDLNRLYLSGQISALDRIQNQAALAGKTTKR